ncbi:MAG: acyltransferase [Cytophagaceae bacterium]|nr:MAG: acyltransferase [Cytophagaceae bacterium]
MSVSPPAPVAARAAPKPYFPALTGVRAVAAYLVCFYHYNPYAAAAKTSGWQKVAFLLCNQLHIGVNIFFVLSGFLIGYRYYEAAARFDWQWLRRYLQKRVARIYPLYFLLTLLTFGYAAAVPVRTYSAAYIGLDSSAPLSHQLWLLFLNLSLLKGFSSTYNLTGIGQAWSLTVEECFYLSAPFWLARLRRSAWAWAWLPAAPLLLPVGLWALLGPATFYRVVGPWDFVLHFTFFGRCLEFFIGLALAVFLLKQPPATRPHPREGGRTLAGALALAGCLLLLAGIGDAGNAMPSYAGIAVSNTVVPLAIALLFYGLLTERTWLRSLLSTKLFNLLGKSSYAFYLIHLGVIDTVLRTYLAQHSALRFLALNLLAIASYQLLERPLYQWLAPQPTPAAGPRPPSPLPAT